MLKPDQGVNLQSVIPGRRPSQKVKVLKLKTRPSVVSADQRRRPSQKVKVLKRSLGGVHQPVVIPSQTFPEGKGVETRTRICW